MGRVVVIGGGVGGLSAAIRLAVSGHSVTLLEKNDRVGGKLNRWVAPHPHRPDERPFTFDTGPSLLTLPLVFADLFSFAGRDVREILQISRLDPISRFVWRDGQTFELRARRADLLAELERFSPDDVDGFLRLLRDGQRIWNLSGEFFLAQAPEQAFRGTGTFSPVNALKLLTIPLRIGMFRKYSAWVDRHIRSPRLRDVVYQYATYTGSSPQQSPATLGVIPHVEIDQGAWYVPGGMYRLAELLEASARESGVVIRTGCAVDKISVDPIHHTAHRGRVSGVRTRENEFIPADAVVVNADVPYAYRELISPEFRPIFDDSRLSQLEPGGSGLVLMLGVEGTYPQLTHHNKFMPDDASEELRAVFETRTIPRDPCIYVCASTRSDPTQAPEGCENLFVLCSAPPLDGAIDWSVESQPYRDRIIDALQNWFGLTDLRERIVVERRFTPADLRQAYNANAGSIYGISSNGVRNAFARPPNRDRSIQGLFFAGGATHPGGGLPLVALSGKIASELVREWLESESSK